MKKVSSIIFATAIAATGVLMTGPAASAAGSESSVGGAVAALGQQKINLKQDGWGSAASCVVYSKTSVRCFKTHEEADRALGYSRASDPLMKGKNAAQIQAIPACASGWLCLYEHADGGGRRLIFSDYYWHNLNEYGFNDQTSSWRNNQGSSQWGWLARDEGGRGGQISISPNTYSSNLGAYNDWASSVAA
ncbi:peptidase inhibitor family I36 protein [Streptomyces scabiei]|uniref:peptidase inhibitor family I36 protein n=1 Tax=Streptomyces scabiei TaxID=1930 RepID=UPI0038F5D28E